MAKDKTDPAQTVTGLIVQRAAREVCAQSPSPAAAPTAGNALSPQSLLGVVSYCYAKGVFTSEDIERKLRHDPAIQAVCGEALPDAHVIRRFRRLHRQSVLAVLERLFRFRRKQAAAPAAPVAHDPKTWSGSSPPARESVGETTLLVARTQAQERLDQAVFIDHMSQEP